ncbi:MAG: zinc-binding dehydrogenase, partial [Candidatus Methanoperedens sp.]|nr:zinc-binding dehydrogenase [Candidatus Methanoperedens sp.]
GSKMGADILINVTKESLQEAIIKVTDGKGADLVIEASGAISALNESLDLVKIDGRIALLGFYEQKAGELNIDKAVFNCIKIIGVAGSPNMYKPTIDVMASGKVNFRHIITHRYPFKDAIQAFTDMKGKNDARIKIMVEF